MKTYCWIALLTLAGAVWGQPPDTLWTRIYGSETTYSEELHASCQANDGGFLLVGQTYETLRMLVIRIDSDGNQIWSNQYSDNTWEGANSVQLMSNGDYIIAGSKEDSLFTIRVSDQGDIRWNAAYKFYSDDREHATSSVATLDGGALIVGWGRDIFAIRYNTNGDTIWTKTLGENVDSWANGVACTSDSGFIIVGGQLATGYGEDIFISKLTSEGDTVWTRLYHGPNDESAVSVMSNEDGTYTILSGISALTDPLNRILLMRINSQGDTIGTRTYLTRGRPIPHSFCRAIGGGYLVIGTTTNISPTQQAQMFALRISEQGDTLWSSIFHRSEADEGRSAISIGDGTYLLGGHSHTPGRGFDMYLVKTRPDPFDTDVRTPVFPSDFNVSVYPNPFNATTTLSFSLPHTSPVSLTIFNVLGQAVYRADLGTLNAGEHSHLFDANKLPSGVYLARVQAAEHSQMRKMVLLK